MKEVIVSPLFFFIREYLENGVQFWTLHFKYNPIGAQPKKYCERT